MAAAAKRTKAGRRKRRKKRDVANTVRRPMAGPGQEEVNFAVASLARVAVNADPQVRQRRADMEKALSRAVGLKPTSRTRAVRSS
jgi:hypothetical protein